jgi:single-stranded DNA-specific DHH superfamily exonuclease
MLTKKQILEIREHLEKAQNPVFFYDNDPDGLCSFLLLRRYINRGKGIAIKSFPEMNTEYSRKAKELNSDYVFILDKPVVSKEFFSEINELNIPVVWIDHHEVQVEIPDFVSYYNPIFGKEKSNEPVTYLCYKITENKNDLWVAIIGCISDRFVPEFYSDFGKNYPDLFIKSKDPSDIFYKSQIGEIANLFSFALKDRPMNVSKMTDFLIEVKSPYEILEENQKNNSMHSRFKQIYRKYSKLLEKAKMSASENKILFFQYGGDMSISADLSNELFYLFPEKIIVVVYLTGIKANISIRGKNVRTKILKILKSIEGATGGGHENAVGARIKIEDIENFKEKLEKEIN